MTAEEAMERIWSILCPDCGPEDYENIVISVSNAANPSGKQRLIRRSGPVLVTPGSEYSEPTLPDREPAG